MSKVFFSVAVSADGYIAGPNGGPDTPLGDRGPELHEWMYPLRSFRELLSLGYGGLEDVDDKILKFIIERTGADIMGKNMFSEGEKNWPENAPFHHPVFVLTHEKREPWERKGGTTFYFGKDGIHTALEKAKEAAGDKDIRISGGAHVIQQYLAAGLVDEFYLHLSPITLGAGVPLFTNLEEQQANFEIQQIVISGKVTHHRYSVKKNN